MRLYRITTQGGNVVCHCSTRNWGYGYNENDGFRLYQRINVSIFQVMMKTSLDENKSPIFFRLPNNRKVIVWQDGRKVFINGFQVLKNNVPVFLHTIFIIANRYNTDEDFDNYLHRLLTADPVVTKAITDKVLYTFYKDDGTDVETLLTINLIGDKEIAIELNPGTWVPMSVPKFKSFYNAAQGRKNKFSHISPEELYHFCTGKLLSEGDRRMTHAFLEQNRKSALREKRSLELIQDLQTRFKGIEAYEVDISGSKTSNYMSQDNKTTEIRDTMFVEGKQLNWCVLDRNLKSTGRQDVSTYQVTGIRKEYFTIEKNDSYESGKYPSLTINERQHPLTQRDGKPVNYDFLRAKNADGETVFFYLNGPICIDNADADVSLGDQFAGRALALLNDNHSMMNVSTLRGYSGFIRAKEDTIHGLSELQIVGSKELLEYFGV